jgi:hypothetical protein
LTLRRDRTRKYTSRRRNRPKKYEKHCMKEVHRRRGDAKRIGIRTEFKEIIAILIRGKKSKQS